MVPDSDHVWYAGYGSNLCERRFMCYIEGGRFIWGGSEAGRCADPSPPMASMRLTIPHRLYFARNAKSWGDGGVAFLGIEPEPDETRWTHARLWKITEEQYRHVMGEEGSWYARELNLGKLEGIPVKTFTHPAAQEPNKPAAAYLRTISLGLRELGLGDEEIARYLAGLDCMSDLYAESELRAVVGTARMSD